MLGIVQSMLRPYLATISPSFVNIEAACRSSGVSFKRADIDLVVLALQTLLAGFIYSREAGLLICLTVFDHLGDALGGKEDDMHTVSFEAGQYVLIGPVGDWPYVRLKV